MDLNNGVLSAVVWPVYCGVLDCFGAEPWEDYQRGMIRWSMAEDGEIQGSARILVPKGYYTHLSFYYHPVNQLMVGCSQFSHPMDFRVPGQVDLERITRADFTQQALPHNGFVLPV